MKNFLKIVLYVDIVIHSIYIYIFQDNGINCFKVIQVYILF